MTAIKDFMDSSTQLARIAQDQIELLHQQQKCLEQHIAFIEQRVVMVPRKQEEK